MAVNPNALPIPPHARKQFEDMGEAFVCQACNGSLWPSGQGGSNHPMKTYAFIWLAEIDEEARKRTEVLQAKEMVLAQSTLKAAWIAAIVAICGVVVTILTWAFPRR
jgi:hypothetical protein